MKQEKLRRRLMATLLIFAMVLGIFPVSAIEGSEKPQASDPNQINKLEVWDDPVITTEGAIAVKIFQKQLEDGKYYVNQNESLVASEGAPHEGIPYLYYEEGVLTVSGGFIVPKKQGQPSIIVESGKLRVAGSGSLELESDTLCVYFATNSATLELSESVDLFAMTVANGTPAFGGGRLISAEGYSGQIYLESKDTVFSNMQEVKIKTTRSIDICGAKIDTEIPVGGSPVVNVNGPLVLEGSSVKIKTYEGYRAMYPAPLVICREDLSLTATRGDLELSVSGGNAPAIIAEGNVTLSAKEKVKLTSGDGKNLLVNFGMRTGEPSTFTVLQAESIDLIGRVMGGESSNLKLNATGNITMAGSTLMDPFSEMSLTSTEGEISIIGQEQMPLIQTGNLNFKAKSNILVRRTQDEGLKVPIFYTMQKSLQSENGLVIISGSTESSITTAEGQIIDAVYGGDITTIGLDIENAPTEKSLYTAGQGYVLLSPDESGKGAKLEIHNATIESNHDEGIVVSRDISLSVDLYGKNQIKVLDSDGTGIRAQSEVSIQSTVGGSLEVNSGMFALQVEKSSAAPVSIRGNAVVSLISQQAAALVCEGSFSVEPTATFEAKGLMADVMVGGDFNVNQFVGSVYKVKRPDDEDEGGPSPISEIELTIFGACDLGMVLTQIPVGASSYGKLTLNIPKESKLIIGSGLPLRILDLSYLKLEGSIENHGVVTLPVGTSADTIKALNLRGSGGVFVPESTETKDLGQAYTNKGILLNQTQDDLDLNTNEEVDSSSGKAYTWMKTGTGADETWTLTLKNTFTRGTIRLPDAPKICINVEEDSVITGNIQAGLYYPCDLSFTGKGVLNLSGGIQNGVGGTITLEKGAHLELGSALNFGASGGTNSTLNVHGKDTLLNVVSNQGAAIYCDEVNVLEGATLKAQAKDIGVKASSGVTISGGATLSSSCTYALYILGGKLTLDKDSYLLTNGSVAPFCIVDSSSSKTESEVLSLAGIPAGTEIASVKGSDAGYGYNYWSLVKTGGSLQVADENSEPVTLGGAVQGEALTFQTVSLPPVKPEPPLPTPISYVAPISPVTPTSPEGSNSNFGTEKDGVLRVHITEAAAKEGIKTASKTSTVVYNVTHSSDCHSLVVTMDHVALETFKKSKIASVKVGTAFFDLSFNEAILDEMMSFDSDRIIVSAMKQMQVSNSVKRLIENRPTYEVTFALEKKGGKESIKAFDKGLVTMGIGYKSSENENLKGVYALFVNQSGSIQWLSNSRYDSGKVLFARKSPTTLSVGYKMPSVSFRDINRHWGKEDIEFVAGLELIRGIKAAYFEPNMEITRGTFLMALGQLSGADMSLYTTSSFKDVEKNDPAMPYIEWAVKNKIIQGIGNGEFGIHQHITRQDMAVMMQSYAKVIGYKIPMTKNNLKFMDEEEISSYASEAVSTIQKAGIIKGKGNNRFDPKGNATRAEASSILRRFVEFVIYEGLK